MNLKDLSEIAIIDSTHLKIKKHYRIKACGSPSGLTIDKKTSRLFSVCENRIMAITNPKEGKLVAALPIGAGADAVVFDSHENVAFSSNGIDGDLTVIKEVTANQYMHIESVLTAPGARTLALDEKTGNLILISSLFGPKPTPTDPKAHVRAPIIHDSVFLIILKKAEK